MVFVPVCKAVPAGSSLKLAATKVERDSLPDIRVISVNRRFSRHNRLTKPAEFRALFASGKRIITRDLLIISRNNQLPVARLGMAISKKNVPQANKRNRLKRIIRDSFRNNQHHMTGMDVLVLATKHSYKSSSQALFLSLEQHWKKIKQ